MSLLMLPTSIVVQPPSTPELATGLAALKWRQIRDLIARAEKDPERLAAQLLETVYRGTTPRAAALEDAGDSDGDRFAASLAGLSTD